MDLAEFKQRIYGSYFTSHFGLSESNRPSRRSYAKALSAYRANHGKLLAHLPPGARVLDVACGTGHCLHFLAGQGFLAEGVDLSEELLALAKPHLPENVRLHRADALVLLRQSPETYDAIVCNNFIEHLSRPDALELVDAIFAALKPGGTVLLRVPNAGSPSSLECLYCDLTHEWIYTHWSAIQLLAAAGFQDAQVRPFVPPMRTALHVLPWLAMRVSWVLYKAWIYVHDLGTWPKIVSRSLLCRGRKPLR